MNSRMGYWVVVSLAFASICWSMQTAVAKDLSESFNSLSEGVRKQSQAPPEKFYASCGWGYAIKGQKGWHTAVSPVYEYGPSYLTYACLDFGRWVVKNHSDIRPEFDPDSPKFVGGEFNPTTLSGGYTTKGQAETARQKFVEKRKSYNEIVEDLEWTPKD